jgi:hypothetical protein
MIADHSSASRAMFAVILCNTDRQLYDLLGKAIPVVSNTAAVLKLHNAVHRGPTAL